MNKFEEAEEYFDNTILKFIEGLLASTEHKFDPDKIRAIKQALRITSKVAEQLPALKDGELLPCPFCGGEATNHRNLGRLECYQVHCLDCDCASGAWRTKEEDAIKAWNTRAIKKIVEVMK